VKQLIAILCILVLGACTSAQQQTVEQAAAKAKTQLSNACLVVQPPLVDLAASLPNDANLALLVKDNAAICAAVNNLDPSNVQNLINTIIPSAIAVVNLIPMDPGTATAVKLALGAASLALSNFLIVYGQQPSTAPAVPASGASAVTAS